MKKVICHIISIMMVFTMIPFSAMGQQAQSGLAGQFTAKAATGDSYTVNISGTYDYSGPQEMIEYVNQERQLQGVGTLTLDADLTDAAMQRAAEIAYYFSHTRPDGTRCFSINSRTGGENIAAGSSTASGTYTQWYNSKGHYENMVRARFTNIGIGHFYHNGIHYWVQMFSRDRTKSVETRTGTVPVTTQLKIVEIAGSPLEINGGIESKTLTEDQTLQLRVGAVNADWTWAYCVFDSDSFRWTSSNEAAAVVSADGLVTPVGVGEITVTATVGSTSTSINIKVSKDLTKAEITGIENTEYTGSAITFPLQVTYKGETLRENTDYIVAYKNNENVGSAEVIITGIGSYTGTITKRFSIQRKNMTDAAKVYLDNWDYTSYESGEACVEANLHIYDNGRQLQLNKDYYIYAAYEDNESGKVTDITVYFQGNYTGLLYLRCLDLAYAWIPDQCYTGGSVEPDFQLYWDRISYGYYNRMFNEGIDYTVEFSNNKEVGTATVKILPTARTYGSAQLEFRILEDITTSEVSGLADVEYTGSPFTPEVKVVHKGQVLKKDTDYTVTYRNNRYAGTATVIIEGIGKFMGNINADFQIHKFEWAIDKEATEISTGIKHLQCIGCEASKSENTVIPKKECDHVRTLHFERGATCTKDGNKRYYTCDVYGLYYADAVSTKPIAPEEVVIPAFGHKFEYTVDQPAEVGADGSRSLHCRVCDIIDADSIMIIPAVSSVTVTGTEFGYNGFARKPAITVTDINGELLQIGEDYSVKYKNQQDKTVAAPKNVGKYTAVITFTGDYGGSVSKTFMINPKATSVTKITKPAKKQIKITWQKRTAQVTGYEIQYSTTKTFTKATTKNLKVTNYKTNIKTIKNLKAKKKYWVRVRTYKIVNSKPYYSAWSGVKVVTTK